ALVGGRTEVGHLRVRDAEALVVEGVLRVHLDRPLELLEGHGGPAVLQVGQARVEGGVGVGLDLGGGVAPSRQDEGQDNDKGTEGVSFHRSPCLTGDAGAAAAQRATAAPGWRAATAARRAWAVVSSPAALARSMASTHIASNFLPARKRSRTSAASKVMAFEYGRSVVMASKASATATMRPSSGICS